MSAPSNVIDLQAERRVQESRRARPLRTWQADVLARLSEWFAVEFHLFDGSTGELLHRAASYSARDWDVLGELCRAVAARGKAELIEEIEPLLVMAVPVEADDRQSVVAVAAFVTRNALAPAQLPAACEILGVEADKAARWIGGQNVWLPDVLLRMGQLATERLDAEWRLASLDREVRDLSLNLASTYEEISLIYRLTQNLKLTSKDEELASLALQWLADVLPAKSLAIQLTPADRTGSIGREAPAQPMFLSHGPCPITGPELTQIIEHVALAPGGRPLIVNRSTTSAATWPWPAVRQLIVVSLCEGNNCFGWLVAFNHVDDAEFGTVEASLLSSIAAILGIHSGNSELYEQQREIFAGVVRALTSAIDAKDPYTCGHSDRVARVSVRLAEELGCDRKQVDTIYLSGLLHDVGKIGVDDTVLRKPGKLTEAEYEHIKTHAEIGHRILSDIKQLDEVLPVVLHHHEQWNGQGYPRGLAGADIPMLARIVAVADSFDAMGSDRPYRPGLADEKLDAILRDGAGQQWDADVVEAFFRARDDIRAIAHQEVKKLTLDPRGWTS
jgi:putative nucleotidyltransferase with HDIG domain